MSEVDLSEIIPSLQVVVAGHVDVGKSSLVGKIYYTYGDKTEVEKKAASANKAMVGKTTAGPDAPPVEFRFLCDNSITERTKGNTINYHSTGITLTHEGCAPRNTIICDAPGHVEFAKNFVTGTVQSDMAIMLVPASQRALASTLKPMDYRNKTRVEDSKKMPCVLDTQLRMLNTFGLKSLLVCVNKMGGGSSSHTGNDTGCTDDIEPWNEQNFKDVCSTVMSKIKKNGFATDWVHFMPIDVFSGDNLWSKGKNMPWWKGIDFKPDTSKSKFKPAPFHADSIVEYLCKMTIPTRNYSDPLRMCVQSTFKIAGAGNVYSCKIFGGICRAEQMVYVVPAGVEAKVKSIEIHRKTRKVVGVGDECGLVLAVKGDKGTSSISPGSVFGPLDNPPFVVKMFIAKITLFGVQKEVCEGFSCVMDIHVVHVAIVIERILDFKKKDRDFSITGNEPECLTWNPVLTPAQLKAAKAVSKKMHADAKYKPTEEEKKLVAKLKDPFSHEPCGNAYLDGITAPLKCTDDVRQCLVRIKPDDSVIMSRFVDNSGIGRFCMRNSHHVVGVGVCIKTQDDVPEVTKKGGAGRK